MGAMIAWIIVGLVAGAIAKLLMPGRDPGGAAAAMLLGSGGALLGGSIGRLVWGTTRAGDWNSFASAIIGAILLLVLYRLILGRHLRETAAIETVRRNKSDIGRRDKWAA
jgi:uncharacterized membrane protein YeaQ/YmgE (transglycosylase-associated protein family)